MSGLNSLTDAVINVSLKPSWLDYTLLGATSLAVLISAIAIWVAINTPKKIAKEQNKIALFQKRFEVYEEIQKISNFYLQLQKDEEKTLPENQPQAYMNKLDLHELDVANFLQSRNTPNPDMDEVSILNFTLKQTQDNLKKIELVFQIDNFFIQKINELQSTYTDFLDDVRHYIISSIYFCSKNREKWKNHAHELKKGVSSEQLDDYKRTRKEFMTSCENIKLDKIIETLKKQIKLI